jgi:hypothetical protein
MRASFFLIFVMACGGSSSSGQDAVSACTHVCQCETNTTDASCHTDCANAPPATGSTSFSLGSWGSLSTSGSLSSDPFGNVDQACIDCYAAASCASILAGTACTTECQ